MRDEVDDLLDAITEDEEKYAQTAHENPVTVRSPPFDDEADLQPPDDDDDLDDGDEDFEDVRTRADDHSYFTNLDREPEH